MKKTGTTPRTNQKDEPFIEETTYSIRNCTFKKLCDAEWDQLTNTDDPFIRFCGSCQKNVYFCEIHDDVQEAVQLGRCVAIVNQYPLVYGKRAFLLGDIKPI